MDATTEGALVAGAVGTVFLAIRALVARAIAESDKRTGKLETEMTNVRERVMQLEGTINGAWGLEPAVRKLDHNVERLTSAVEHIGATVETLMRVSDARSRT